MSGSHLEIIELTDGKIILQRASGEGEPLVTISFSPETEMFLKEAKVDIAKVMIHAGVQAVGQITEFHQAPSENKRDDEFEIETEYFEDEVVFLH